MVRDAGGGISVGCVNAYMCVLKWRSGSALSKQEPQRLSRFDGGRDGWKLFIYCGCATCDVASRECVSVYDSIWGGGP